MTFCLTCRTSGITASQRLGITDYALAWDVDNAVTQRLFEFDMEKDNENRKFWVALVGGGEESSDSTEGAEVW